MRFRAKFGALSWCWVGLACFVLVLWASGLRARPLGGLIASIVLLALVQVIAHIFIFWDVDADGLRERRLWKTRTVAWRQVHHVGSWNPRQPASDYLSIEFTRAEPSASRGRVIAHPEDRDKFIATLRRFAPDAIFDV